MQFRQSKQMLCCIGFLVMLCFLLAYARICHSASACSVDFSSPQKTIETYYEYHVQETPYNRAIVSSCFYPPGYMGKLAKFWLQYEVVDIKQTELAGETVAGSDLVVSSCDVEIIVSVKENHPEKGNPKTKYWYLLHEFLGAWKIVEHYHIPDENYPPYD